MALKKNKFRPEDIEIVGINILESTIKQTDFFSNPVNIKGYNIDMANETAYNQKEKAARYRLFFEIEGKDENDNDAGISASIQIELHFKINNSEKYFATNKQTNVVDYTMAINLMSVAYATARGIVWQLTLPSALGGVVLPVIDAGNFLKQQ